MRQSQSTERGQTLVIFVLVLVGLLVAVGLAVDGGNVFLERRRMQNAADAASLAGTRRLAECMCDEDESDAADAAIHAAVIDYAQRNGVERANDVMATYLKFDGNDVVEFDPPVVVGGGSVPEGAAGVAATTGVTRSTNLVSLVGIDKAGASAAAESVTGPPLTGGGLRPLGVPLQVVEAVPPDQGDDSCFTLNFRQNCHNEGDCTVDYIDGQSAAHRGWMNFDFVWRHQEYSGWPRAVNNGTNASTLATWMTNGWNGTLYADCLWSEGCYSGDYVDAKPGQNQSVFFATPIDELFYVPIFDQVADCPDHGDTPDIVAPYPDDSHPGPDGDEACQGGQNPSYYHIVGFAGVIVPSGGVAHGGGGGNGSIELCLQETIMGKGEPSPNAGFGNDVCATHTMVVTLWE